MVARFVTGNSIRGILRYNEDKVTEGEAVLIMANGFATEIDKLNFHQKLYRFEALNQLKPSVKSNAVHISLNFHEADKLDTGKLQKIAAEYMEKIGFGEQPYIVYRHLDTNHPHIHIATNRITRGGNDIYVNKIGYRLSEPARKELEVKYGLIKAEGRNLENEPYLKPAEYGTQPTKKQLNNITKSIMRDYAYTTFNEYKAVLAQFNVHAERGHEDSIMYEKKGIVYSIRDENGNPVGVPFKASAFYRGATMKNLEKQFEDNRSKRKHKALDLKSRIDGVLVRFKSVSEQKLSNELAKEQIALMLRKNESGQIYGTTFIDHKNRTVFNGRDLGKEYAANGLRRILSDITETKKYLSEEPKLSMAEESRNSDPSDRREKTLLDGLLDKADYDDPSLIGKKKKRRPDEEQSQNYQL